MTNRRRQQAVGEGGAGERARKTVTTRWVRRLVSGLALFFLCVFSSLLFSSGREGKRCYKSESCRGPVQILVSVRCLLEGVCESCCSRLGIPHLVSSTADVLVKANSIGRKPPEVFPTCVGALPFCVGARFLLLCSVPCAFCEVVCDGMASNVRGRGRVHHRDLT